MKIFLIFLILMVLSVFYYFQPLNYIDDYQVLLTISTFLFSIFTGFFISRQGSRYNLIRDNLANFDGNLSGIYRQSMHLDKKIQNKIKKIIVNHYNIILHKKTWHYNFTHKSSTITSIHDVLEKDPASQKLVSLPFLALGQILSALKELQQIRKRIISLFKEAIPSFQWILLFFSAIVLFATLSSIPSANSWYISIVKASFASAIIFVFMLLYKLYNLEFFDKSVGIDSAKDVLDIIKNKK